MTEREDFRMWTPIAVAQMIEVDRLMIEEYGITLPQMMENAGRSLAALSLQQLGGNVARKHVVVLVGKGNNGGGGLVAARHLANAAADVSVALSQSPPLSSEVAEQQRLILQRMGIAGSNHIASLEMLHTLLPTADLVIDALVGYRLRGAPREPIASFIHAANAAPGSRLALDLPSGLEGDSGVPTAATLRAAATLTLAWPKTGLLVPGAQPFVGKLFLADISVPEAVYQAVGRERGTLFATGPIVPISPVPGGWQVER
jgi:NAD(P)H-hydrate epimerase